MSKTAPSSPPGSCAGEISVPGDKSISHRSIMLGSLAEGDDRGPRVSARARTTMRPSTPFVPWGSLSRSSPEANSKIDGKGLHGLTRAGRRHRLRQLGDDHPADDRPAGRAILLFGSDRRPLPAQTADEAVVGPPGRHGRPDLGTGRRRPGPPGHSGRRAWHARIRLAHRQRPGQIGGAARRPYAEGVTTVREPHLSRDHSERMLSLFRRRCPALSRRCFGGRTSPAGGPGSLRSRRYLLGGVFHGGRPDRPRFGTADPQCRGEPDPQRDYRHPAGDGGRSADPRPPGAVRVSRSPTSWCAAAP